MTAAAEATSRVSAVSWRARVSTTSPSVSGTAAACTAAPDWGVRVSSPIAARNSSTCSGMPSLRLWIAATSWAGAGLAKRGAGHGRGLVQAQPRQPDLLGKPLGQQAGTQLTQRQAGAQLVAAVRTGDQHLPTRDPARQMAQHIKAQLIGPVQILENDQHRAARLDGNQQVGQVLHQQAAPVMRVTSVRRDRPQPRRQALPQASHDRLGRGQQIAGQVHQQPCERLHITRERRRARTTAKPQRACRAIEPSRRVLPMPASPATKSIRPAPAAASARRPSMRVR